MRGEEKINGIINFLKPPGMTSHDVVDFMRKVLKQKKIGHTGTLDPAACGVLPLCVGKATRLAEYAQEYVKSYRVEIIFGIETDTLDMTGNVLDRSRDINISKKDVLNSCRHFNGTISQIPPDYSAVRYKGARLYEYARKGIEVSKKPRTVEIKEIEVVAFYKGEFSRAVLDVTCSKGTYIRTLCSDIGKSMGVCATVGFLVRTASGPFKLTESITNEEIKSMVVENNYNFLKPMHELVEHLPTINIDESGLKLLKNGRPISVEEMSGVNVTINTGEIVKVMHANNLAAIGNFDKNKLTVYPKKVFI